MIAFTDLINQKVERLFIMAWPPLGEDGPTNIDLSLGFVWSGNSEQLCIVTTDEDAWTPCLRHQPIPNETFVWKMFEHRMQGWMDEAEMGVLDTEYYEVTNAEIFANIVAHTVEAVELLNIENGDSPFGVRLKFANDFVLSHPIADGNIFQTSRFNQNDNLLYFEALGTIQSRKLKP